MDITYRFIGDLTVLGLSGRLTVSPGETEILPLRAAVGELVAEGRVRVALDLAEVTHLDARGLAELVLAFTTLRRQGGELTLVAPSVRVRQLLAVTRLDTVFTIRGSVQEATGAAAPPEQPVESTWDSTWLMAGA